MLLQILIIHMSKLFLFSSVKLNVLEWDWCQISAFSTGNFKMLQLAHKVCRKLLFLLWNEPGLKIHAVFKTLCQKWNKKSVLLIQRSGQSSLQISFLSTNKIFLNFIFFNLYLLKDGATENELSFWGTPWSHSHSYTFTPGSHPVQRQAYPRPLNSSTGVTGVRGLS